MAKLSRFVDSNTSDRSRNQITGEVLGDLSNLESTLKQLPPDLASAITYDLKERGFLSDSQLSESAEHFEILKKNPFVGQPSTLFKSRRCGLHSNLAVTPWIILGIPCDLGAKFPGCRWAPKALREKSQALCFRSTNGPELFDLNSAKKFELDKLVQDIGDLNVAGLSLETVHRLLAMALTQIDKKHKLITLGGDHSFTATLFSDLYKKLQGDLTLVQIDQHMDLKIWGGNAHEPLAHGNFVSRVIECCPEAEIFQFGVKRFQSCAESEIKNLQDLLQSRLTVSTDEDLRANRLDGTIGKLNSKRRNIYLSLDVDVFSSWIVAQTGYPAQSGVSLESIEALIGRLSKDHNIVGIDVMELGGQAKDLNTSNGVEIVLNFLLSILSEASQK